MVKINKKKSIILTEGMYSDSGIVAFILSIAIKFSTSSQKIVCIQTPGSSKISKIIDSPQIKIIKYRIFFLTFLRNIKKILLIFISIKNNNLREIEKLFRHNEVICSNEFHDTMSIKNGIFWGKENKIKLGLLVLYEFLIFKYVSTYFKKNYKKIDLLVIGDTSYRYGYFAKISANYNIPIICNLDLNSIYFNYYPDGYQFKVSRPIPANHLEKIKFKIPEYSSLIRKYFIERVSGNIKQHDVLNAYKIHGSNQILDDLPNDKIIVSVFAHVFSDAPHNIPGLLFEDFHSWFIETIKALIKNNNVFIILKEHPSAHLYNFEKGLVSKIIESHFPNVQNLKIVTNVSPSNIIDVSDFIITASGTIIFECLFNKKNLIIASKPTFENFYLLNEFKNNSQYLFFLEKLTINDKKLIESECSDLISFFHFFIFNNRDIYTDFPLKPYVRGDDFSIGKDEFNILLNYVKSSTKFSQDLEKTIAEKHENFIPKLLFD